MCRTRHTSDPLPVHFGYVSFVLSAGSTEPHSRNGTCESRPRSQGLCANAAYFPSARRARCVVVAVSLQLSMLMHALWTCFGSCVRPTSTTQDTKSKQVNLCYRCTERVSVHFVRPAAQSISSCTGSVPEVDLAKIELLRLGTFLYPSWFGTSSARFGHTPRHMQRSRVAP